MSSLSFGQWSVCSATVIGYFVGDDVGELGQRDAPVTMSLTPRPEPNSAPPVENWMMPSLPASANPFSAALMVSD